MKKFFLSLALLFIFLSEGYASDYPGANFGIPPQKMLIMFWSINCGPCRYEMENLPALAADHPETKFLVLSIDKHGGDQYLPQNLPQNVYATNVKDNPFIVMRDFGNDQMLIPYSVMTHSDGSICQNHIGILGSDQLTNWSSSC